MFWPRDCEPEAAAAAAARVESSGTVTLHHIAAVAIAAAAGHGLSEPRISQSPFPNRGSTWRCASNLRKIRKRNKNTRIPLLRAKNDVPSGRMPAARTVDPCIHPPLRASSSSSWPHIAVKSHSYARVKSCHTLSLLMGIKKGSGRRGFRPWRGEKKRRTYLGTDSENADAATIETQTHLCFSPYHRIEGTTSGVSASARRMHGLSVWPYCNGNCSFEPLQKSERRVSTAWSETGSVDPRMAGCCSSAERQILGTSGFFRPFKQCYAATFFFERAITIGRVIHLPPYTPTQTYDGGSRREQRMMWICATLARTTRKTVEGKRGGRYT